MKTRRVPVGPLGIVLRESTLIGGVCGKAVHELLNRMQLYKTGRWMPPRSEYLGVPLLYVLPKELIADEIIAVVLVGRRLESMLAALHVLVNEQRAFLILKELQ